MAKITHNISNPNDGLGDQLRTGFGNQNLMNTELYETKVDKVAGKGLSTNDFSNIDKAKLDALNAGAEVNIQSDWEQNDNTKKDFIKNKPAEMFSSVGSFHYVDLATKTTPLNVLADVEKKITNDTADSTTNVLNAPYGISSMWNVVNNQLDFTQTAVGDLITVIPAIEITTTAANQTFQIYLKTGIGSTTPTTKQVYNGSLAVVGSAVINATRDFTIDTLNDKDFPSEIYILSNANATVKSGELDIKVVRKNINVVNVTDKTKTSEFINDGDGTSPFATDSDLNSKQDILTAGANITITGNVISASGGGGGTASFTKSVTQTAHGFIVGNTVKHNGTTWVKSQANSLANSGTIGVVSAVTDANTFVYSFGGFVAGSYVNGTSYFLSPATAGLIITEPTYTDGQVREFIGTGTPDGLLLELDLGDVYGASSQDVVSITNKFNDVFSAASINLYDETKVVPNSYVYSPSGVIKVSAGWTRSEFIPVTPLEYYTLSFAAKRTGIAFFDASYNPVAGTYSGTTSPMTLQAPATALYCSFNVTSNTVTGLNIQFEKGQIATVYKPYSIEYTVTDKVSFPNEVDKLKLNIDMSGAVNTKITDGKFTYEVAPYRALSADVSNAFDFRVTNYNNTNVHTMNDEAAPYRVFGTTIGANHGYAKSRVTQTAHGKVNADVGSVWTDGVEQFVLVNVFDANNVDFSARNSNNSLVNNTLTHVSGATNTATVNTTVKAYMQMYPCFKNRSLKVFVDNNEVVKNGEYLADNKIVFKESYEIMEKNSIMEWLITQVGTTAKIIQFGGTAFIKVAMSYVFNKENSIVVYTDFLALQNISIFGDIMFNMNNKITAPYSLYIPKTLPLTHESYSFDFTQLTNITTPTLTSRIDITPSRAEAEGILCDRALMLRSDVGFSLGFLSVQDASIANRRVNVPAKALQISESKKIYMSAIDGLKSSLVKGDYFSTISYKSYFEKKTARTANYIVELNDSYFLYLDWHQFGVDNFELPVKIIGLDYSIIEKSSNVSVLSKFNNGFLTFDVNNSKTYGYCILKFNK